MYYYMRKVYALGVVNAQMAVGEFKLLAYTGQNSSGRKG